MALDVRRARRPADVSLDAVHEGAVWHVAEHVAARAAVSLAEDALRAELGPEPRLAHRELGAEAFFDAYTRARDRVLHHSDAARVADRLAAALGLAPQTTRLDHLRLRAVPSGGHRHPPAAAAYHVHRDTWYANPPAQVNLWIAVGDVAEDEAFDFWPAHWDVAVANDSHLFDLQDWHAAGGWQKATRPKPYPHALVAPTGPPCRVPCGSGESLLFSATHLHGTHPHDSGRTRFSLELRLVRLADVPRLALSRRLDDRSRGSTLAEMRGAVLR
jgi:ectoine hydroxylase-related dioxygenase (phytanoyl-CoA dioxygenase family)